ncbi:hypothetical protein [Streptomyces sp. NPDC048411]|uniref:hypothetical protein n=1 Tax=Streptomyces sp. NPDC048411 TaxID=3157206 RepID=UPI00345159FD
MRHRPARRLPHRCLPVVLGEAVARLGPVYGEPEAAYGEAAQRVAGYHQWLVRHRRLARPP